MRFPSALHSRLILLASLLAGTIGPAIATDAPPKLAVGDAVPALAAKDQHDKEFTLADDTQWLLIAFDMGTGKAANGRLEKKGATWLDENHAVYVSNIHGMPGVGRMFALPKMRKYPHRIVLADADGLLDAFPETKGMVTVLKLKPGRVIEAISTWDPRKEDTPF